MATSDEVRVERAPCGCGRSSPTLGLGEGLREGVCPGNTLAERAFCSSQDRVNGLLVGGSRVFSWLFFFFFSFFYY